MAVERWEIILKICFRYEKHSSESEQYASKKIRVIRRVEMKILQEMDENVVFPTAGYVKSTPPTTPLPPGLKVKVLNNFWNLVNTTDFCELTSGKLQKYDKFQKANCS